ncbi:MAG TPA: polyphosphate polymerase domain-containing protein [Gemmatimonadales bacterium]|nr:polyphosphate polymerase domain-containing protein [Gemmatimonadales bacterium]
MPNYDTLNRFELKYLVPAALLPALRRELAGYTRPDANNRDERGYPVYSVYWDSPEFTLFWEKVEGLKCRRKLRFRRYGDSPEVFVEIKQRIDRTLHKRRFRWPADCVVRTFGIADGLGWDEAAAADPVAAEVLVFCRRYRLAPRMAISYRRHAFFGVFEPELRITFDTRVQYSATDLDITRPFSTGKYVVDPRNAILEIKFNHRVPKWLSKLVCRHGFRAIRMSKYCSAVDREFHRGQLT